MSSFSPIGSQDHLSSDSFWPSFTDIMMVVVMIFLFATSMLIVRNYHLVAELQDSLAAGKLAEEVIETTSLENANLEIRLNSVESEIENATQENATLEERLANYEHENSLLRLQVLAKNEQLKRSKLRAEKQKERLASLNQQNQLLLASIDTKDRKLNDNKQSIVALNTEKTQFQSDIKTFKNEIAVLKTKVNSQVALSEQLNQKNTQLSDSNTQLNKELDKLSASNANKNAQLAALKASINETQAQIDQLTNVQLESENIIALLKEERQEYNQELLTLKGEYDVVQAKYQKLIKPARSAKGKYIAEVHYIKSDDKNLISYKEPGNTAFAELTLSQVEKKLNALKKKYGSELYVKIIIPKNSGLTYSEAWTFMKGLLDKYDYYYQAKNELR